MGLTITALDSDAFSKIGGALDNLSDAYPYVSKAISSVDAARDALQNSGKVEKFFKKAGKGQKIYSYASKAKELLDEKTRDGAYLKLGVKIGIDIAGKLLGTSLSTHPYYAYHKAMIDYLADAVNAHRNAEEAIAQYRKAVSAAQSEALTSAFYEVQSRKASVSAQLSNFRDAVKAAIDIARGHYHPPMIKRAIAKFGAEKLLRSLDELEEWRMAWSGLAFDALQLQIMAGAELHTAEAAMAKMRDLIKTLISGNNLNKVFGYGAQNQIQWEQYDQLVNKKAAPQSVMDPVAYARGNLAKATRWAEEFSAMCDFARTEDALFEGPYNRQLEKLNEVLYGRVGKK
jgi:hypothetical protein